MRKISYWAKHNTSKARFLIVLSEITLFLLAVNLGLVVLHSGIRLPGIAVVIPLTIFGIAIFMFHYRKVSTHHGNRAYWMQRLCIFLVGFSMFLMTSFFVGSEKLLSWNAYSSASGGSVSLLMKPAPAAGENLSVKQLKQAARLLRKMRGASAAQVLYIVLTLLGGAFLLLLVATLACSVSCSGNGFLAIVLLLLGFGGVLFLCLWLIRKIMKHKAPEREKKRVQSA